MQSTDIIKPSAMVAPLAYGGTKNSIPEAATGTNAASVTEGFPAVTSLSKADGGMPPQRADFNGMFYLSTDQRTYLQNGGIITFEQEVSDLIGGYPKGAILDYVAGSDFTKVRSLIEDNTYNFNETPSYIDNEKWEILSAVVEITDLSNLTTSGLDKLNQSKALTTGNVSEDKDVFADIQRYYNSGNKTGIDTVKPDDYTVVGEPVISSDGILTYSVPNNVDGGNNVRINANIFDTTKPFTFSVRINRGNFTSGNWLFGNSNLETIFTAWVHNPTRLNGVTLRVYDSSTSTETNISFGDFVLPSIETAKIIDLVLSWDMAKYTIKLINAVNKTEINTKSVNSSLPINNVTKTVFCDFYTTEVTIGISYDLNFLKLYQDNQLAWQATLRIPYTQSKTGSKIVDAAYRDRVQDVYEQFGTAMYYTIDEENENFTLPMGEIYGMIEQKSDTLDLQEVQCVVETYQNGTSWYRVWSDGWIEQGGTLPLGSADIWVPVTLLKPYRDTNYSVLTTNTGDDTNIYNIKVGSAAKNTLTTLFITCNNAGTGVRWRAAGY